MYKQVLLVLCLSNCALNMLLHAWFQFARVQSLPHELSMCTIISYMLYLLSMAAES